MIYENYGTLDCIEESFYFQLKGKKLRGDNTFWLGTQVPKVFKRLVRMKYKKDIEVFKPKETILTVFKHHSDNILKDEVTIEITYFYSDYRELDAPYVREDENGNFFTRQDRIKPVKS